MRALLGRAFSLRSPRNGPVINAEIDRFRYPRLWPVLNVVHARHSTL